MEKEKREKLNEMVAYKMQSMIECEKKGSVLSYLHDQAIGMIKYAYAVSIISYDEYYKMYQELHELYMSYL